MSSPVPIPVFVGYDPHERAAVNVLIDSIYQHSSVPLAITPILASQLTDVFSRERNPLQSTEFSFTRFLVPHLMGYQGWAVFMDCDMLCRGDLAGLWNAATTDKSGFADRVMGRAKWSSQQQRLSRLQLRHRAVDASCLKALFRFKLRQDGTKPL